MKRLSFIFIAVFAIAVLIFLSACSPTEEVPGDNHQNAVAFTISGNDASDYVIITNRAISDYSKAAESLIGAIADKTGVVIEYADEVPEGKHAIYIGAEVQAGKSGYRIRVDGGYLYIESAYLALTSVATDEFIAANISALDEDIEFPEGYSYQAPVKTLKYSDFGAVGDGIADDYLAIKKTHEEANKYGYTVEGDADAVYLLGATGQLTIPIKTDTDWRGASFIIDDRSINTSSHRSANINIFTIQPDMGKLSATELKVTSLAKGAENLGCAPGVDCLVYIQCNAIRRYIRYGASANSGAYQQEIMIVRADGTIDENTRPVWDYPSIDKIWAVPINERGITVENGSFKTLANTINPTAYIDIARGISITRSNTTIKNVNHTVEQVESYRAAYSGFFSVNSCNNILIYDCEIFCHKDSYYTNNKNEKVLLGSYELSAKYVNNLTYDNVFQTNFFTNEEKTQILDQGLMGTNYCKNMYVKNSRFARFDTHCGVYNLTITNSELQRINVTGSGTVKIENTIFWGNYLTNLRNDYGGLFDGDFYFKDITVKYSGDKRISLFSTKWYNHDFGFTVIYPQNVYIDNLKVESGAKMYLFSTDLDWKPDLTADTVNGSENLNPIVPVKLVEIKSNPHGTEFVINTGDTFKDTKLEFAE